MRDPLPTAIADTTPVFIVSSGRSGTQMVDKLLTGVADYESHHEYLCAHVQPLAALYYMGLMSRESVIAALQETYSPAIHYSRKKFFSDSSNKLSWLIDPLYTLYPQAKFVYLVRDGRKVVSSFFNKLGDEIYDDTSVSIMRQWLNRPDQHPVPPPEKKYWWNIPRSGQPFAEAFASFNQVQRIAYHWVEVNRVILESLAPIPAAQQIMVKLEDLVASPEIVRQLLDFLEIEGYEQQFVAMLKRPHNVNIPQNFYLTREQTEQFMEIAWEMMARLGYGGSDEYAVNY